MKLKDKIEDIKYDMKFFNLETKISLAGLGLVLIILCLTLLSMFVGMYF